MDDLNHFAAARSCLLAVGVDTSVVHAGEGLRLHVRLGPTVFALWAPREGTWAFSVFNADGVQLDYGTTALSADAPPERVAQVIDGYHYDLPTPEEITPEGTS